MKIDRSSLRYISLKAKYAFFRRWSLEYYNRIKQHESFSREELQMLTGQKICNIVNHAYANTEYYKEAFHPLVKGQGGLIDPDELEKLPILDKLTVRSEFERLIAKSEAAQYRSIATTGGSTGVPLKTLRDRRVPVDVIQWRTFDWWGVPHDSNCARAWRIPDNSLYNRIVESVKWWPGKVVRIDASALEESVIRKFLDRMVRERCEVIFGYVGAMQEIAKVAIANNFSFPALKAVWTTAAPLSESLRKTIREGFGAPVYDEYGSCEIMRIAAQASESGPLRVFSDLRYVEVVDDEGNRVPDGKIGNLLVTDLENRVFPLIRYKIGDRGRIIPEGDSEDASPFQVMDPILGRNSEVFHFPNGITIPGEYLTTLFDAQPEAVTNFQVMQKEDYSVIISVVPGVDAEHCRKVSSKVAENLRLKLDNMYPVEFNLVDSIAHDSGKLRYVKSQVRS